ncbi:TPA: hypothetical protein ACH27Q_004790 [Raoultella ornithinolytica]
MEGLFFSSGSALVRTLIIGVLAYVNLIILLRLSGRRTLSKMNALALLIVLQFSVTWSSVRAGWFRKLVTGLEGQSCKKPR